MTNFDYIISQVNKLTDRDLLQTLLYDQSSYCNLLGKQITNAFKNWQGKLSKNWRSPFSKESVFVREYDYELVSRGNNNFYCLPIQFGRPITISYQVWLSKQYNPEEWDE